MAYKSLIGALAATLLGLAVLPLLASAQMLPCSSGFVYPNSATFCGTGTLQVYVQVSQPTTGTSYNPSNFTVQVSGLNPSPATFPGSLNGTLVSLGAGSYSVAVTNNSTGFIPSYSQGCTGNMYNGSSATCVITMSSNNGYYPYPIPYPYPYTYPQLTCTPAYQTASLGQTVSFTAVGGSGNSYNWSTPSQTYLNNGGPTLTITLPQSGTQVVTVTNGNQTASCTVNVAPQAGPVIYPSSPTPSVTSSYYPTLPNTGFEPQNGISFALAAVMLIAAGLIAYPYVRKALAVITR